MPVVSFRNFAVLSGTAAAVPSDILSSERPYSALVSVEQQNRPITLGTVRRLLIYPTHVKGDSDRTVREVVSITCR